MTGKSKEEIAFELVSKLKGVGVWGENNMSSILDMYAVCLEATSGKRKFKDQTETASQPAPQQPPMTTSQPNVQPMMQQHAAPQPQQIQRAQQPIQPHNTIARPA